MRAEYWEKADGKTGAGYGGDVYTFIREGALVDFEFMTFAGMMELLRCPFVEAYFPMADVQQEEVIVAHWMSCKVVTLM